MNPLDRPGERFSLTLANPNPKARRRKDGPRYFIEFEVDAETWGNFMDARELAGMVVEGDCYVAGEGAPEPKEEVIRRAPNELARRMHLDGYFRNAKLWAAMEASGTYTQEQHKAWIESLTCFIHFDGAWKWQSLKPCAGEVCGHHVHAAHLPAAGDTTDNPRKPPHWYLVPLCFEHHNGWVHAKWATREDKQKLLEAAVELTALRMKMRMKEVLRIASLSEITPEMKSRFERDIGLTP